jgi:uncharacterized protein YfiM (DUF2279 family)
VRKWTLHIFLIAISLPCFSQEKTVSSGDSTQPLNYTSRKWLVGGASAIGYTGTMYLLNNAWYKDYPRSSFHVYNDAGEWNQMDKIGHAWSTYTASRVVTEMWKWAGVGRKNSVLLGTGTSLLFMTSIEYLDGLSEEWGWSWPDMGMNLFGAGLFAAQELGWKEQKIQLKFSTHYIHYEEPDLEQRANDLFGNSWPERMLKDYNAQTYWLSANIASITKSKKIPSWLNLAFGYGAGGMFGGYENVAYDKDGNVTFDRRDIERYRQFYLAPDIDFTRIKTRSKFLKTTFFLLNAFKFPAPAIEFSKGKFYVKAIVF